MFDFDYDYIETINNAYWAEEEEMKAGTHPLHCRLRKESRIVFPKKALSMMK